MVSLIDKVENDEEIPLEENKIKKMFRIDKLLLSLYGAVLVTAISIAGYAEFHKIKKENIPPNHNEQVLDNYIRNSRTQLRIRNIHKLGDNRYFLVNNKNGQLYDFDLENKSMVVETYELK